MDAAKKRSFLVTGEFNRNLKNCYVPPEQTTSGTARKTEEVACELTYKKGSRLTLWRLGICVAESKRPGEPYIYLGWLYTDVCGCTFSEVELSQWCTERKLVEDISRPILSLPYKPKSPRR